MKVRVLVFVMPGRLMGDHCQQALEVGHEHAVRVRKGVVVAAHVVWRVIPRSA